MAQAETVVGPIEATRNVVTIQSVDMVRTGAVDSRGRIFVGTDLTGEHIEYALYGQGVRGSIAPAEVEGPVACHDADALDQNRVGSGGYIHVGKAFEGENATIVVHVLTTEEKSAMRQIPEETPS